MEKAHSEAVNPIHWARSDREKAVRSEAWKSGECSNRVARLRAEYKPQLEAIEEQRQALWEQYKEIEKKFSDMRNEVEAEPYQAVYNDAEYKALTSIIQMTKKQQKEQLEALLESFKN
jgi:chromosome segregation ATPase